MRYLLLFFLYAVTLTAKEYRGAEYRTKNYFTYGRFEVRMKSAHRDGMLSSFFTYNDSFPATPWNEIDIEIMGRYTDDIQFNPITPGQVNHEVHYQTPFNPSQDFHIYAFEWTPTSVAWFVDGKEVHRQAGAHIEALKYPQKLMMNVWNPAYANWAGAWNANVLPAFAYYDWVSYSSFTPDSGNTGTDNKFKFQWKDDFNSWDQTRWDKASHTWGGNQCDMYPDNVVFKDGVMILCLTTNTTSGYYDKTGPSVNFVRAENSTLKVRYTEEVDQVSAETVTNYYVTGNQVTSATLQPDSQSVHLTLAKYDTATLSTVIIFDTKDRFANPIDVQSVAIQKQKAVILPLKINCGGLAYSDYVGDQEWGPGVEYGRMDGKYNANNAPIAGVSDATIYHTELTMPVKYFIRVPNGTYDVELQMAETNFSAAGNRVFSVAVQDSVAIQNLDLAAVVGKNVAYNKVIKNVTVTDELIDIHFMASKYYALINGIVISKSPSMINEHRHTMPNQWDVGQNYPNPFNASTIIPAEFSSPDNITIRFYDSIGRKVSEMNIGSVAAGRYNFSWNAKSTTGKPLASGVYFYVAEGQFHRSSNKLVLIQ